MHVFSQADNIYYNFSFNAIRFMCSIWRKKITIPTNTGGEIIESIIITKRVK